MSLLPVLKSHHAIGPVTDMRSLSLQRQTRELPHVEWHHPPVWLNPFTHDPVASGLLPIGSFSVLKGRLRAFLAIRRRKLANSCEMKQRFFSRWNAPADGKCTFQTLAQIPGAGTVIPYGIISTSIRRLCPATTTTGYLKLIMTEPDPLKASYLCTILSGKRPPTR